MWTHETLDPLEPNDEPIEFERLSVGANWNDLEIIHEGDGRFYIQAVDDCDGEIEIGMAEDLEDAKRLAETWAIDQIADMLKRLGAQGIWMVRGNEKHGGIESVTYWLDRPDAHGVVNDWQAIKLDSMRLMLIRFPTGDGREGVEYYG